MPPTVDMPAPMKTPPAITSQGRGPPPPPPMRGGRASKQPARSRSRPRTATGHARPRHTKIRLWRAWAGRAKPPQRSRESSSPKAINFRLIRWGPPLQPSSSSRIARARGPRAAQRRLRTDGYRRPLCLRWGTQPESAPLIEKEQSAVTEPSGAAERRRGTPPALYARHSRARRRFCVPRGREALLATKPALLSAGAGGPANHTDHEPISSSTRARTSAGLRWTFFLASSAAIAATTVEFGSVSGCGGRGRWRAAAGGIFVPRHTPRM